MLDVMDVATQKLKLLDINPDKAKEIAEQRGIDVEDVEMIRKWYVAKQIDVEEGERAVVSLISTATQDRDGEILDPKGVDLTHYKKNPVVGYAHDIYGGMCSSPDPDKIIGKGKVYLEDDKLMGEITFEPVEINEFADKILKKVDFGTLRATSVGFYSEGKGKYGKEKEAEGEENETFYYAGQELLEFSIVNIPSNPEAVKRSMPKRIKDFLEEEIGKEMDWEDIEKLTVKGVINIIKGIKPEKSFMGDTKFDELEKYKLFFNIKTKSYDNNKRIV